MNLKLSGSDNISSYMVAISRLKSKALSIQLLQLCEAESVSYLDEVASNSTTHNMAKLDSRFWHCWYWLQSLRQVSPVERFLEKPNNGCSRSSSRGSSLGRSPVRYDSSSRNMLETWRRHIAGGKLKEITEEAKIYSIGKKALAALFVHTPAGALQRQIRNWLVENFDFLSIADDMAAGATGQLEILSTTIMNGWMVGLGAAQPPTTDALGQLSEYARYLYTSQLQHL
ncbi:hypothetical protein SASPL_114996 [Salvia splendens]|uniref:Nodulin homeobox N-terminal domain-containing protein n=1 Tax=Salvia splendens TaxID=180675 RepID=A0A8X8Y758_SALSN|nr:hypothetical protein SASPL_114996 [Salvia splendens]